MALEDISALFASRSGTISAHDIAYGIERFLQSLVRSQTIQCRSNGDGSTLVIRVGTPALAQIVAVCEYDIHQYAKQELACIIKKVCVLL